MYINDTETKQPFVVSGESGSGKTALMASMIRKVNFFLCKITSLF